MGKERHEISVDKGVLKMTVRLHTDGATAQVSAHEVNIKKIEINLAIIFRSYLSHVAVVSFISVTVPRG